MDVQVFIATHKDYAFPQLPGYVPIFTGSAFGRYPAGILRDDTGVNISHLNKNFCELTALYWMWKNCTADIQGLVHYRRYLYDCCRADWNIGHLGKSILDPDRLPELLPSDRHLILPQPQGVGRRRRLMGFKTRLTVVEHYALDHIARDWLRLEETVKKVCPEYHADFIRVARAKKMCFYNIFIARRAFVHHYCDWLFNILFEMSKQTELEQYDAYQQRVFGFLAERLLNVYIRHHRDRLNILYLQTTFLE